MTDAGAGDGSFDAMASNPAGDHRGLRVIIGLAAFIVAVAGLKAAGQLVLPTMMALFLSLLCVPPMRRLESYGVPSLLAVILVVTAATLLVFLVLAVIGRSITHFQDQLPFYQKRLDHMVGDAISWLEARGIEVDPDELTASIDSGAILRLVGDTASGLLGALSNLFLVILTMIFMLLEAQTMPGKLRSAIGDPDADLSEFGNAALQVQKYLAIKAYVSLATAVLIALWCWICGVDFPLLWALVAFLFNFVPNIGSIIAAIPAVLLALVQFGLIRATIVGAGYMAVNMVIGNIIEPRLMGRRLGLSTLVVFLSMLFWGWVWGPVGMLLSVPLTVIVKILCEHSDDFRWVAIMLGPGDDPLVESGVHPPDDGKTGPPGSPD